MSFSESRKQQYRENNGNRFGNSRNQFRAAGGESSLCFDDRDDSELRKLQDVGNECDKLFKELSEKMNSRFRRYTKLENELLKRYNEVKAEAKALAEEKKIVASWKQEAAALQAKTERDLNEIRNEREQLERASTDLAVQLAELKRTQRDMEKQKTTNPPPNESSRQLVTVNKEEQLDDVPLSKRIKLSKPEIKKKEVVTNKKMTCIQAALQEDAPGLFELLEERGLLDDMDVITNVWEDDLGTEHQDSETENFNDLATVVTKLWRQSMNLTKETRSRIHVANSSKPNYCLPCLVSLVEQTRLLKQRKWPVKWGWCRPLNSFLFVFEKHNRIVVERPEYGFATYFFELVQSVPVKWQVERLIKVMSSVGNCRAALLENRPLEVGTDLLPQEAAVLEDYGWSPNTGIGSLLNFCDRVLHDYRSDEEAAEWKSKIGKMLMDGHDHGSIVLKVMPRRLQKNGDPPRHPPVCTFVKQEDGTDSLLQMVVAKVKQEPLC